MILLIWLTWKIPPPFYIYPSINGRICEQLQPYLQTQAYPARSGCWAHSPAPGGWPGSAGPGPGTGTSGRGGAATAAPGLNGEGLLGAGLAATPTVGVDPRTVTQPSCHPKKMLLGKCHSRWSELNGITRGRFPPLFPPVWVPIAPGNGKDGAVFARHVIQPLKNISQKRSGAGIHNQTSTRRNEKRLWVREPASHPAGAASRWRSERFYAKFREPLLT